MVKQAAERPALAVAHPQRNPETCSCSPKVGEQSRIQRAESGPPVFSVIQKTSAKSTWQ
jgi:hypothetical protein